MKVQLVIAGIIALWSAVECFIGNAPVAIWWLLLAIFVVDLDRQMKK